MATRAGVRVEGARELRSALKRAGRDLSDLKAANARVAAFIATSSRPSAPRRTGQLVGTTRGNKAAGKAVVLVGNAATPYAAPIHWGWPARGIEPQTWVTDTAKRTEPTWLGFYQEDVDRIVESVHTRSLGA